MCSFVCVKNRRCRLCVRNENEILEALNAHHHHSGHVEQNENLQQKHPAPCSIYNYIHRIDVQHSNVCTDRFDANSVY